jgi:succinate dehydrogenase / fumarate reductase flavoprotein subunit
MGGTWVDYNLMTTIQDVSLENQTSPDLEQTNERAPTALMQGLADGYFVLYNW